MKIGVIGGGQLGRMLALAGTPLTVPPEAQVMASAMSES